MTENTGTAIRAILAADSTVTEDAARAALDALTRSPHSMDDCDRIMSRAEVAAFMGKSVKSVDIYGRQGVIRRVYLTVGGSQRSQSQGYSRNSVLEAMKRGKPTAAQR